ncbi:MSC_0621 family F1-like ATPase epsilon subunit [Mycoplasmopsis cricetuli]|uniref:MSC_0621 family F1-like ATPase epsilon subunit n=1 Tax=Mycoplasmopsis cricetuli TaxID=171283 RepID=UPI0012EC2505|nr:hypothetical protein [Mycoplasmopsis cricetuli]
MKQTKKHIYKIIINFTENKIWTIFNAELELYLNDELKWIKLNKLSIASFENILVKIQDHYENKIYYIFLKNANFIAEDNKIEIISSNEFNYYYKTNKQNKLSEKIKITKKELSYFKTLNKIEIAIENIIKINELKTKLYTLEMIEKFSLSKWES